MQRLYSVTKAYHSTRQKGLKKFENRTTAATIDTGEGAHIHGWGLYLQADEMQNRKDYYYGLVAEDLRDVSKDKIVTIGDDEYYMEYYAPGGEYNNNGDYNFSEEYNSRFVDKIITMLIRGYSIQNIVNYYMKNNEYYDYIKNLLDEISELGYSIQDVNEEEINPPLEDGTHSYEGSQYTVEIPDDMVFIDEDKQVPDELVMTFVDTLVSVHTDYDYHGTDKSFYGKKNYLCKDIAEGKFSAEDVYIPNNCPEDLEELLRTRQKEFVEDLYGKREAIINNVIMDNGRSFYSRVSRTLGGEEKASLWLSENGIDGMTYEGGQDHGCFVIYNCDKLKIVAEY